jgi:hypothetical protein
MTLKNFILYSCYCVITIMSCKEPIKKSNVRSQVEVVKHQAQKKQLYIGYLNSFSENMDNAQFFCSARLKRSAQDKFEEIETEAVKHKISQIDEYSTRYAVLESHSDEYFETDKEIWIYNIHSNLIAKGKFVRHELYDQNIDSELISAYDLDFLDKSKTLLNIPFYYANIPTEALNEVKWKNNPVLNDKEKILVTPNEFTKRVDKSENKVFKYIYNGETYTFFSDGNIYCFLSAALTSIVFKEENAMIFDMTSTAFIQNGKPVFLLSCGQPETDYFYNYALVWNGKSYEPI